jgi:flagellar biosynthetic protein FliQ
MTVYSIGDIMREALFVILKLSLPLMLVGLVVGVVVSLIQALTQIQEQSLTFVPKMLALFVCMILMMSFMSETLIHFTQNLFAKMQSLE